MPYVTAFLKSWLNSGHRIGEFASKTGLTPGYTSQLFSGDRGISAEKLAEIISKLEPEFADDLVRAWLLDQVEALPSDYQHRVQVNISPSSFKLNDVDEGEDDPAKKWAIKALENDPEFLSVVKGFWIMLGKPRA